MRPIYFPYTFIPAEIAEAYVACFDQIIVYQPSGLLVSEQMVAFEKKGLLDIRVLVKGDEEKILSILRDYKQWANVHSGGDDIRLAFHGQQKDQIPFLNESSIMKIKEDMQRKISKTDKFQEGSDPFLSVRVFLHMAHEFDMQNHDIRSGIRQFDKMEHELMKNLQGEESAFKEDAAAEGIYRADDPFDFMIIERIEAWSGLMLHHVEQNEIPGLFVTSNRSIFTHMVENSSAGEMVLEVENIPFEKDRVKEMQSWRDSLMKNMEKYIKAPWTGKVDGILNMPVEKRSGRRISLSLYIVPGENPFDFFARFYPNKLDDPYTQNKAPEIVNTLIGLLEIKL